MKLQQALFDEETIKNREKGIVPIYTGTKMPKEQLKEVLGKIGNKITEFLKKEKEEVQDPEDYKKLIAVLLQDCEFSDGSKVTMISYVFETEEEPYMFPYTIEHRGLTCYECLAFVDNITWDISEWGYISLTKINNNLIRVS